MKNWMILLVPEMLISVHSLQLLFTFQYKSIVVMQPWLSALNGDPLMWKISALDVTRKLWDLAWSIRSFLADFVMVNAR